MTDDLRPRGTVEVECSCEWCFWVDSLDPRLPDGPFFCHHCDPHRPLYEVTAKAES